MRFRSIFTQNLEAFFLNNKNIDHVIFWIRKVQHHLYSKSSKGHGIHSPSLFRFVTMTLSNPHSYYAYKALPTLNKKENFLAKLLYRLVIHQKAKQVVEWNAMNDTTCNWLANHESAAEYFCYLQTDQSANKLLHGETFKQVHRLPIASIPENIPQFNSLDLAVFHPTENPDEQAQISKKFIPLSHENSIFVFCGIHSNRQQRLYWRTLQNQPEVTVSIDLFEVGILLFKKDLAPKKLRIRLKHA